MGFFRKLRASIWGTAEYPDLVALEDRSNGFGYMVVLLTLVIGIAIAFDYLQMRSVGEDLRAAVLAAPNLRAENGQFKIDGPVPYRNRVGSVELIVDPWGNPNPFTMARYPINTVLVGKSVAHLKRHGISTLNVGLSPKETYAQADLGSAAVKAPVLALALNAIAGVSQVVAKSIDAVILALVGLAYAARRNTVLPFHTGWRLGLHSITLPTMVQWLVPGYTTVSWWGFTAWWGIALYYFINGINRLWRHQQTEAEARIWTEAEPTEAEPRRV